MRLICNDMNDMMDAIEQELQKIDRDMMDADLVQTRALPWRNLLASSHEFLNVTQATSTKAVSLCRQLDAIPEQPSKYGGLSLSVPFAPANSGPGWFRKLPREFDESRRRAVKLQRDINETSLRLQSNFAILSAREQIIEARSITNLTELAFFFIPFSFSAAVFSMQVHVRSALEPNVVDFRTLTRSIGTR